MSLLKNKATCICRTMQQTHQLTNKLSNEDIDYLIKNPVNAPIQFMDRYQNGDFGLLPIEIWDKIYSMKKAMELNDENERLIKEAEDKIINCYYSWREDVNEEEDHLRYSYDNFDVYCDYIELDEEYDDIIIKKATERASKFFNKLHEEATAKIKINCIEKEMNINKPFLKQNAKMQRIIRKYLLKNKKPNRITKRLKLDAGWDDYAEGFKTKKGYRTFIKDEIIKRIEI